MRLNARSALLTTCCRRLPPWQDLRWPLQRTSLLATLSFRAYCCLGQIESEQDRFDEIMRHARTLTNSDRATLLMRLEQYPRAASRCRRADPCSRSQKRRSSCALMEIFDRISTPSDSVPLLRATQHDLGPDLKGSPPGVSSSGVRQPFAYGPSRDAGDHRKPGRRQSRCWAADSALLRRLKRSTMSLNSGPEYFCRDRRQPFQPQNRRPILEPMPPLRPELRVLRVVPRRGKLRRVQIGPTSVIQARNANQ